MAKRKISELDTDEEIDIVQFVQSFSFLLRVWAIKNNVSHQALTSLLKILREEGHTELPKDSRKLLETPKKVNVSKIGKGVYWYRSLKDKLTEISKIWKLPSILKLSPFRSSKLEFWPIQCSIKGIPLKPFFVGLHLGRSKPTSLESFLRPLINDLGDLLQNGLKVHIDIKMVAFNVELHSMILDAPARAFIKCIKGHGGYFSCERCTEEGVYVYTNGVEKKNSKKKKTIKKKKKPLKKPKQNRGHVCFIGTESSLRTDKSFRERHQEDHHHDVSPIEELPIDMVRFFPVEYMHLLLLGIMKKLLLLWVNGANNFKAKLSALDIRQISDQLLLAGKTKPSEINRACRGLDSISNWKATELRTFLLKTGPVVMRGHLSEDVYNHFLAFHCATTICTNEALLPYTNVAKYLYKEFVDNFGDIYGYQNYCYNVHSAIHITTDVERFGVLDIFSAFPGESNLGSIKRMLRGGYKPLQQIVKRIYESELVDKYLAQATAAVPQEEIELKKGILMLKDLRLDSSDRNRWILTKNNNIFKISGFSKENVQIQIHGAILHGKEKKDLFDVPIKFTKSTKFTVVLI